VEEKNKQLIKTAELCKGYDVQKLVAVNPIEYINYYDGDFSHDPVEEETKAQDEALKIFDKTTILRSNLVFGSRSYMCIFLTQNWMEDFSFFESSHLKHFRFHPIYYNDLNDIVQILASDDTGAFNGKKLIANGGESLSYSDIDNIIKQTFFTKKQHLEPNKLLQKAMFNWQLLFHGNVHVTNMNFMLQNLHNKNPQSTGYESTTELTGEKFKLFREYHTKKAEKNEETNNNSKIKEELLGENPADFRFPKFHNYWNLSLD